MQHHIFRGEKTLEMISIKMEERESYIALGQYDKKGGLNGNQTEISNYVKTNKGEIIYCMTCDRTCAFQGRLLIIIIICLLFSSSHPTHTLTIHLL